jgi:cytochrome oxidase Cu insertion factor (SCO1/SenC/PrrC family)
VTRSAIVVACALAASSALTAQRSAETIDVQELGPRVGAAVPAFNLPDQTGQPRTLQSVMGPSGVVLVFFRSADW